MPAASVLPAVEQCIVMPAETRVPMQPEGGRTASFKGKAELLLALLCMLLLFAAVGFSELDNDYVTSTRLTAAIQRIVGNRQPAENPKPADTKASLAK